MHLLEWGQRGVGRIIGSRCGANRTAPRLLTVPTPLIRELHADTTPWSPRWTWRRMHELTSRTGRQHGGRSCGLGPSRKTLAQQWGFCPGPVYRSSMPYLSRLPQLQLGDIDRNSSRLNYQTIIVSIFKPREKARTSHRLRRPRCAWPLLVSGWRIPEAPTRRCRVGDRQSACPRRSHTGPRATKETRSHYWIPGLAMACRPHQKGIAISSSKIQTRAIPDSPVSMLNL